ncbi:MAG: hypothetical protein R3229_02865 [Alphaproteobacteria bacterium]|nr:hypothetical protein [Alphaproteobacteria bacterium]
MADLFLSAKQKLARVTEIIAAMEADIAAFNATDPYTRLVETDPEGLEQDHAIALTRPLPEGLADLTLEAVEALRAALDHAVFAASKAAGSRRLIDTCFPIAESREDLAKVMDEKCKGVPPEVARMIRETEPYKGGNELIWALAVIPRAERYQLIAPIGSVDSGLTFVGNEVAPRVRWDARKKVIELGVFPIHGKFRRDISVRFSAAFGAVEGYEERPVVPLLRAAAEEVQRILDDLEKETGRLGLTAD